MYDRLRSLVDPTFRRQRRIARAVANYMAAHRRRVTKQVLQEHFAQEVVAKRGDANLTIPDLHVGTAYFDYAVFVMLTALEEISRLENGDHARQAGAEDGAVEAHVGWARGLLESLFGMDPEEAFNAVGSAVLRLPEVDPPEGQSPEAHLESFDGAERASLRVYALAEQAGSRIAAGVARGEEQFEPTEEEFEEALPLLGVSIAAPPIDGEA